VYAVTPPSTTPWPDELAPPSESVKEFYGLCDGAYFGGHHYWLSVGDLLAENRRWWELLRQYPRPGGGPIDPTRHVILAYDTYGFPMVWDQRTDQVVTFFYRDRDDLDPAGQTLDEFLSGIFSRDYPDSMWQEALRQLGETA
jgi:hypothetical protein